ncbi:hypothetical protein ACOSQ3_027612 [Xanthoceras sorbifolium]
MSSPVLQGSSPYAKLFYSAPDYSFLRVFGCLMYPYLRPYNKYKIQYRSLPCTFLGYSSCHKGYKCLDKSGRFFVVKHVVLNEAVFPYAKVPCRCSLDATLTLHNSTSNQIPVAHSSAAPSQDPVGSSAAVTIPPNVPAAVDYSDIAVVHQPSFSVGTDSSTQAQSSQHPITPIEQPPLQ